jgi:hypothetical protein
VAGGLGGIEIDKITEVLIGGVWLPVDKDTLSSVPFDLDPGHAVPGIAFQTGSTASDRHRQAIYAPLSSIAAVKTLDDVRGPRPGAV